jgi:signal transduction histidine kinase
MQLTSFAKSSNKINKTVNHLPKFKKEPANLISEADYLFELSDNYLNLARLESRRVKYQANTFLIHDLLQECISFMNAKVLEKQQRLSLAPSDSSIYIKADRAKIKQVIINLLSNAIKYTPPQGTIEIEAKTQADEILIIVRDNGCGIPPEAYNEIFKSITAYPHRKTCHRNRIRFSYL